MTLLSCDIDLPTEVDDEYWGFDKPEQPPGRPALVVAFTHFTKLTRNVELALNSIVSEDRLSYMKLLTFLLVARSGYVQIEDWYSSRT